MYLLLKQAVALAQGRSHHWPVIEHEWLHLHPFCAGCGTTQNLQVHHKMPFSRDRTKELDLNNLITLCMHTLKCHIRLGHGGKWTWYNPDVVEEAAHSLSMIQSIAKFNQSLRSKAA